MQHVQYNKNSFRNPVLKTKTLLVLCASLCLTLPGWVFFVCLFFNRQSLQPFQEYILQNFLRSSVTSQLLEENNCQVCPRSKFFPFFYNCSQCSPDRKNDDKVLEDTLKNNLLQSLWDLLGFAWQTISASKLHNLTPLKQSNSCNMAGIQIEIKYISITDITSV